MASPRDQIGYEALQQEALRGVVRAALKLAASKGLPGDHHFFITFKTTAPGVTLPRELLAHYPNEMSIILQNEYWDLAPGETFFSVTLKFGRQPKSLSIPYAAITYFRDPSVEYQLRFTVPDAPAVLAAVVPTPVIPAPVVPAPKVLAPPEPEAAAKSGDKPNIVSLDQFRKK
jgi:hypothetical protein